MRRTSFVDKNCSVAQALELVGEWWTILILRDALLGVTRFDHFHERLGIARNVLTARLERLVEAEILERRVYDEARGRTDYVLTKKGKALWPVVESLRQWGDEWVFDDESRPLDVVHTTCGSSSGFDLTCRDCGEPVRLRDLRATPGAGATGQELPIAGTSTA